MKKFLLFSLLLVLSAMIMDSCKKTEPIPNNPTVVPFDPGTSITTAVAGKVTGQDGKGLSGVEIKIGTSTTTSDANGNFIIPKASLGSKVGFVKASKAGYFSGSRTIRPKEKVVNNVNIQLIQKKESGSFSNTAGGTVNITTGGNIVFSSNSIVTAGGSPYSGTVKVSAFFLDPTTADAYKLMPGELRGITTSNNEQQLASYGMMAVELNGASGEPLQLAPTKTATLTFPVAASIQTAAPAAIPLWFFDETKGMWVEQGTAYKVGSNYVGTVSHFTWWNCDYGGGPITYTVTFVDQNGNPVADQHVWMLSTANPTWGGGGGHGHTASDGSITGNIPINEPITIKMYVRGSCNGTETLVYTANVGPFSANTNGGTVTVTIPNLVANSVTISGTAVDCSNAPLTNGYANINFDNNNYFIYITNGSFSKTIIRCGSASAATATINVFDLNTLQLNTTPKTISVTTGNYSTGQLAACGILTAIRYSANFVDQNGNQLSTGYATFGDSTYYSFTNGMLSSVIIPANKVLNRKVYVKSPCGNILVDSSFIGPYNTNFNAGVVNINVPSANTITISGTVVDCSNTPVTNGYAYILLDGFSYRADIIAGSFSQTITRCNNTLTTATVNVFDNTNHQQNGTPIQATVGTTNIALGSLSACGIATNEFFNFTLNSIAYNSDTSYKYLSTSPNSPAFNNLQATSYRTPAGLAANFYSNFTATGIGNVPFNVNINDYSSGSYKFYTSRTVTTTLTEFGAIGQFAAGTFTGTLIDSTSGTSVTYPISGSFRLRRN